MAKKRASSTPSRSPLALDDANPFCSRELCEELRLRLMRPAGLPLAQDDNASVELEPHDPQGAQASSSSAPVRSQGQILEGMEGHGEEVDGLKKTEGPLEKTGDSLERDMENFMFDYLQEQNEELRQQVDSQNYNP